MSAIYRAFLGLSRPEKWGLLLFLLHSLFYVVLFHGQWLTGISAIENLGTIIPLLEFWWFLPLSLVIVPLSAFVDFKTVFFYSVWSDYRLLVVILIGSFFYGGLGYCIGLTQQEPLEEDST